MTEENHIGVLIVDDHAVVRNGIRFSLLAFDDIELVGEAESGEDALRLCAKVQPDVILMDMVMPGMDGVATTRGILERYPQVVTALEYALTNYHEIVTALQPPEEEI